MSAILLAAVTVGAIGIGSTTPDTARPASAIKQAPAYSTLEAARDTIDAVVHHAAGGTQAVRVTLDRARFRYWYAPDSASGWAFHVEVADTTTCPYDVIGAGLMTRGWTPFWDYSADGPDGTVMGYVTPKYLCVIEGSWDGGDDCDPTYVPAPGCRVTVTCVPREPRDAIR
jgi:hypothetical protein